MSRRNLARLMSRVLVRQGIDGSILDEETVEFVVQGDHGVHHAVAHVAHGRIFSIHVNGDLRIPPERFEDVALWVLRANETLLLGNFDLALDEGVVRFRAGLDAGALPGDALESLLPDLWFAAIGIFDQYLPRLQETIAGSADEPVSQPSASTAPPGDGPDGGERGEEQDDLGPLYAELQEDLTQELLELVGERFGEEVGDDLSGMVGAFVEMFSERLYEAEQHAVEIDRELTGDDAEARITLRAEGMDAMSLRFSPRLEREGGIEDERGMSLFFHTTHAEARATLEQGFGSGLREMEAGHQRTPEGYPKGPGRKRKTRRIPLATQPPPLDDRSPETAVLKIDWSADAAPLRGYEWREMDSGSGEARVEYTAVRRFAVPAALLNRAIHDGTARLTVEGG